MLLPGVFLLHPGPPSDAEVLHAALCYVGGRPGEAMVTGLAALDLHGFSAAPPLVAARRVDVLVSHTRRLRSTARVRVVRARALPRPVRAGGFPVAPVPRALADAVGGLLGAGEVGRLLIEAVRGGHCEPQSVVHELSQARLLTRPQVVAAVGRLAAEGRAVAEELLMDLVRVGGLPDPCWNVELRLPHGAPLGWVDAYWPERAVAVAIESHLSRCDPGTAGARELGARDVRWRACVRRAASLEKLGITLLHLTPKQLREAPARQATVVRAALRDASTSPTAVGIRVLPR